MFGEIRRREAAAITDIFGDVAWNDLAASERALNAMIAALDRGLNATEPEKDEDDDGD
jgi:hypothetical protein